MKSEKLKNNKAQQLSPFHLFTFSLFCCTFATSLAKTNEEMVQVDRDSGTHTPSAVHHTRRTDLSAARTELGGTKGCLYRL